MKKTIVFLFLGLFFTGSLFAQYKSYRVQKGENLDSLSHKFKVSKKAILQLNPDLKKGNMTHKVIVVPPRETDEKTPKASNVQFREYRVGKKETLYSIAKRNNISIADIKKYNPYLYDEILGENDMIRIPVFQKGDKTKDFNKSVQTSTFKNLIHIVMPKETKYGISKIYKMSVEELDSLNPLIDTLHPGDVLKVINPSTREEKEGDYDYYEVRPKQTFYSLTKELGISKDSLERLNPILKELGLQAGMELKIPKTTSLNLNTGTHKVDLRKQLTNFSTKKLAILLPFNLQHFKEDSDKEALLKKDRVLQISLDLYSGIKIAIDSVQKLGISVDAKVYDTQTNLGKISDIIQQPGFDQTQIMIGPLLSGNIEKAAKLLKNKDIAIFSPLTNDELYASEKIVQTRPSTLMKEKVLMSYIDTLKENKNLLILADAKHQQLKKQLTEHYPSARMITQEKEEYLQQSDLTKLLDKDRPNWIIMITDDYGAISNSVSYLNAMRHKYDIRLFTPDRNSVYDEDVNSRALSNLGFTYATVDRGDADNEFHAFEKHYKNKFGINPNPYAIRGFDVTMDALLRAAAAENIFKSFDIDGVAEYVENRFHYQKKDVGGYYYNAVYLINYDKNLQLKVLNQTR